MAEDDERDPEVELARLNEERRLMEQLVEGKGWDYFVKVIARDVLLSQQARDSSFLTTTFGAVQLDGIQSLVYEGYVKGLHAGLRRATEIPSRIIANNLDLAKVEQMKITLKEEHENGSSTDDANTSAGDDTDTDSIVERSAP